MTRRIVTCDCCGKRFESAWTEAEARAEAARNYPGLDVDDRRTTAVVCDDCYSAIRAAPAAK
jgi:Fe2+ or Zn2+ uptake regulation protein